VLPHQPRSSRQHIILEIGQRFALTEVFVFGSAAILAVLADPPEGILTATRDADINPPNGDERMADRISFVIGEASPFDVENGYHARGFSFKTPTYAPSRWRTRTVDLSVRKFVAHCMEPHDVVFSKLGAGHEKDLEFASAAVALGLVERSVLFSRWSLVPAAAEHLNLIDQRISALSK
jgi:hypothetical protein